MKKESCDMKKLGILIIISSLLFVGCDKCLDTEEISCTGTVYNKEYRASYTTPNLSYCR